LWLAFFALAVIFVSFGWREQLNAEPGEPETHVRVFEMGAFDPWYHRETYQGPRDGSTNVRFRGSSGFNLISWSMLAGVLAAVLLSVLVGIEKPERAVRPDSQKPEPTPDKSARLPQHDLAHVYAVIAVLVLSAGIVALLILLAFVNDGIYHPAVWVTFFTCQVLAATFGLLGRRYRLGKFTAAGAVVLSTVVLLGQLLSSYDAEPSQHRSQGWALAIPTPEKLKPAARRFLDYVISRRWNEAAAEMVSYAMTGVTGDTWMKAGFLQMQAQKSEWYPILKKSTPETLQQAMGKATVEVPGRLTDGSGASQVSSCEYKLIMPPPPTDPETPSISMNLRFVIEEGRWKVEHMRGGVFRKKH